MHARAHALQPSKCISIHPDVISLRSRVDFCSSLESLVSSEQLLQCLHTDGGSLYHRRHATPPKKKKKNEWQLLSLRVLKPTFTTETFRPGLFLAFLARRGGDEVEKEVVPGEMDGGGASRKHRRWRRRRAITEKELEEGRKGGWRWWWCVYRSVNQWESGFWGEEKGVFIDSSGDRCISDSVAGSWDGGRVISFFIFLVKWVCRDFSQQMSKKWNKRSTKYDQMETTKLPL